MKSKKLIDIIFIIITYVFKTIIKIIITIEIMFVKFSVFSVISNMISTVYVMKLCVLEFGLSQGLYSDQVV